MRDLGTLSLNGDVSEAMDLKTGEGFIAAVSGDFGTANIAVQWRSYDGSWISFTDAMMKTAFFDYAICAKTPIMVRAVLLGGDAVSPIQIVGGGLHDDRNPSC